MLVAALGVIVAVVAQRGFILLAVGLVAGQLVVIARMAARRSQRGDSD